MVSALRKWWRGDSDRLTELRARVAAGPETVVVPVNWEFTLHKVTTPDEQPQHISRDADMYDLSKALFMKERDLISGKARIITTGPICERCGQSGLAYHRNGSTKMLVCSHVEKGLIDFFVRCRANYGCADDSGNKPLPGSLMIRGVPVESLPCGRHLKMSLRMRFCWFD